MNDGTVEKLAELFERLPGIGPRQAKRFVYALLDEKKELINEMSNALLELKSLVKRCDDCGRAIETTESRNDKKTCYNCVNRSSSSFLLVVEKDVDLENIEKLGVYDGLFHILGGVVSPLNANVDKLRLKELYNKVKVSGNIKEIILATSATNEGDATAVYIEKILEDFVGPEKIKITRLGRGLSTGSYLEFSDHDTLRNALKNRK